MHRNLGHGVWWILINPLRKMHKNGTKLSLQAVRIILSSRFLKRQKERKYWVHPILRYWEEGEFPLFIMELRDITGDSKSRFNARDTRATYQKDHQFLWTRCARMFTVLCASRQSGWTWQSPFWILTFASKVALNCPNASNAYYRCKKSNPKLFFYDCRKFRRRCVYAIDNVRLYLFFNMRKFLTLCNGHNYWER